MVDFIRLAFVFDEFTDVAEVSGVKALASIVVSVMRNPEAMSDNPHVVGQMIRL